MASDHRISVPLSKMGTNSGVVASPCALSCNKQINPGGFCSDSCFKVCPQVCVKLVSFFDDPLCPPSPPLPPPYTRPLPPSRVPSRDAFFTGPVFKFGLVLTASVIIGVLLLGLLGLTWRFYKSRQNDPSRRSNPPILFHTQDSFRDENQGPETDHPIWYINTVGLQQSIIDSITVCKYKKDEGLIEGTDCSVCLSEFEEDESLRLLPKCSHAFHITCIDTWLRSHKNCPMCRAPIVRDNYAVQAQLSPPEEANSNDLETSEEAQEGNIVNNDDTVVGEQVGGGETSELRIRDHISPVDHPCRVLSDLADNHNRQALTAGGGGGGGGVEPMRRSVSMDSVSAVRIYDAVANVFPGTNNHLVENIKNSKSKISSKRRSGSFSVIKLMSSSSSSVMKRSFSSSWKPSSSSRNRSHDSILPL